MKEIRIGTLPERPKNLSKKPYLVMLELLEDTCYQITTTIDNVLEVTKKKGYSPSNVETIVVQNNGFGLELRGKAIGLMQALAMSEASLKNSRFIIQKLRELKLYADLKWAYSDSAEEPDFSLLLNVRRVYFQQDETRKFFSRAIAALQENQNK